MKNKFRWSLTILATAFAMALGALISTAAPAKTPAKAPSARKAPLVVQGRIVAMTKAPRAGSVPYKDAVIALRLSSLKAVQGRLKAREIVVYVWGMRNNKRTKAASYRVGQTLRLPLTPWERAEGKYGSYNRVELPGDDAYALDSFWGEAL